MPQEQADHHPADQPRLRQDQCHSQRRQRLQDQDQPQQGRQLPGAPVLHHCSIGYGGLSPEIRDDCFAQGKNTLYLPM